jgi:hypothetical protein
VGSEQMTGGPLDRLVHNTVDNSIKRVATETTRENTN